MAQLAAELPEDPSPRPPLMEKMQFPPLETSGMGRGEQDDIPNALLQRRVHSSPPGAGGRGGLGPAPAKRGAGRKTPKGLPSIVR